MSGQYELFYGSGGHFGPFETLEEARREAIRRLDSNPGVYGHRIEIRESTTALLSIESHTARRIQD